MVPTRLRGVRHTAPPDVRLEVFHSCRSYLSRSLCPVRTAELPATQAEGVQLGVRVSEPVGRKMPDPAHDRVCRENERRSRPLANRRIWNLPDRPGSPVTRDGSRRFVFGTCCSPDRCVVHGSAPIGLVRHATLDVRERRPPENAMCEQSGWWVTPDGRSAPGSVENRPQSQGIVEARPAPRAARPRGPMRGHGFRMRSNRATPAGGWLARCCATDARSTHRRGCE